MPLQTSQAKAGAKFCIWNTDKEGGWDKFKELTEDNEKLLEVARDITGDVDVMMKTIDKELNRIKYVSFGKVKINQKPKSNKVLEELQKKKIQCYTEITNNDAEVKKIDIEIANYLLVPQRMNFEKDLKDMKDIKAKKGRSAMIFNLKSLLVGPKKTGQEATTLVDPKTKLEVATPEAIKKVSINYCSELLNNRAPKRRFY